MQVELMRDMLNAVHGELAWPGTAEIVRNTSTGSVTETVTVIAAEKLGSAYGGQGGSGAPSSSVRLSVRLYTADGALGCAASPHEGDAISLPVAGGASREAAKKISSVDIVCDGQAAIVTVEDSFRSW